MSLILLLVDTLFNQIRDRTCTRTVWSTFSVSSLLSKSEVTSQLVCVGWVIRPTCRTANVDDEKRLQALLLQKRRRPETGSKIAREVDGNAKTIRRFSSFVWASASHTLVLRFFAAPIFLRWCALFKIL